MRQIVGFVKNKFFSPCGNVDLLVTTPNSDSIQVLGKNNHTFISQVEIKNHPEKYILLETFTKERAVEDSTYGSSFYFEFLKKKTALFPKTTSKIIPANVLVNFSWFTYSLSPQREVWIFYKESEIFNVKKSLSFLLYHSVRNRLEKSSKLKKPLFYDAQTAFLMCPTWEHGILAASLRTPCNKKDIEDFYENVVLKVLSQEMCFDDFYEKVLDALRGVF